MKILFKVITKNSSPGYLQPKYFSQDFFKRNHLTGIFYNERQSYIFFHIKKNYYKNKQTLNNMNYILHIH